MSTIDVVTVHSMFSIEKRIFLLFAGFSEKTYCFRYIQIFIDNNSRRHFFVFVTFGSWMSWGNGMVPFTEAGVIFYTLDKQEPCAENSVVLMSMVSDSW